MSCCPTCENDVHKCQCDEPSPEDKAVAELISIEIREALLEKLPKMKMSQLRPFALEIIKEILEKYYDLGYLAPTQEIKDVSDSYVMEIMSHLTAQKSPEPEG